MKYILAVGALLMGALSSLEAYTTYRSYPTYVYEERPVVYERYVREVPVRVVRRVVEPVRYYYPECRPCYRYNHSYRHYHNPFRGGFSFSFGF